MTHKHLALIFLCFIGCCQPAFARDIHFTASTTALYTRLNDSRYSYKDEYQIMKQPQKFTKNISLGIALNPFPDKNISINVSTNRLTNWQISRKLHDSQTNLDYDYRTSTRLDTIQFGYRLNRFLPQLTIANLKVGKKVYLNDSLISKKESDMILVGAGLGYFLTKNFMVSGFYLAPNKSLHIEGGAGLTSTLIF